MITITIETKEDGIRTNVNVNGKGRVIKEEIVTFATHYADILNRITKSLPITMQAEIIMTLLENSKDDTCR